MVVNGKGDKKKKSKERAFEVDEEAPVVVFDETIYGIKKHDPNRPRPTKGMNQSSIPRPSEDADDIADMEVDRLWERIKDKVDDIHAENLRGKERKAHMMEKVVRLGGEPLKRQQHPYNMRLGMMRKAKEREAKLTAQAREMDIVMASSSSKIENSRSRKRNPRNRK